MQNSDLLKTVNGELRLKTESVNDLGFAVTPYQNVIYKVAPFLNGSSQHMDVNGSSTPVNFDFTPTNNEIWYIEAISIFLHDNGATIPTVFGAKATALVNGVQLLIKSNGIEYQIANIKENIDLSLTFKYNPQIPGTTGLFETSDIYIGQLIFQTPMKLNGSSDYIRFKIRDNLTDINDMHAKVTVWRTI